MGTLHATRFAAAASEHPAPLAALALLCPVLAPNGSSFERLLVPSPLFPIAWYFHGADHVIDYVKNPEWAAMVKELTGGPGADCAFDAVGGDSFMQCVRGVGRGGRIVVEGFVAGFPLLPMNLVLVKGLYVCGPMTTFPPNPDAKEHRTERILGWMRELAPHIS